MSTTMKRPVRLCVACGQPFRGTVLENGSIDEDFCSDEFRRPPLRLVGANERPRPMPLRLGAWWLLLAVVLLAATVITAAGYAGRLS